MAPALFVNALAAGLACLGWYHYLGQIRKETVPAHPVGHLAVMVGSIVLAVIGLGLVFQAGVPTSWVPLIATLLGLTGLGFAGFFIYLLRQAPMPDGDLQVSIGDPLLPFEALDSDGQRVRSVDWKGRPVLLKFFRGHW